MRKQYQIEGMTCGGCVTSVQDKLSKLDNIQSTQVQLAYPQSKVSFSSAVSVEVLQNTLGEKYQIKEIPTEKTTPTPKVHHALPPKSINAYKPFILIVAFIAGVSLLAQYPFTDFS